MSGHGSGCVRWAGSKIEGRRYQAVICDLDGLVLDTEPTYRIAWEMAARDVGLSFPDGFFDDLSGLQHADVETALRAVVGADFPFAHFWGASTRYWKRHVQSHGIAVKPGVSELLAQLRRAALPHALATNSPRRLTRHCLELAGLGDAFPCIVCRDDVTHGKPEPDVFLEAAARLGIAPGDCLVLEDSLPGLDAARRAGMAAVLVNAAFQREGGVADWDVPVLENLYQIIPVLAAEC